MHPVIYSAALEGEGRSRLTVFFRWILFTPWLIVAVVYGFAAMLAVIAAWFALLFTGRYPEGLYNFNAGFARFSSRVNSWLWLLVDEWPPFDGQPNDAYPVQFIIGPPKDEYNRLKVLLRLIFGIPVYVLGYVMSVINQLIGFIAWFVLVFAAKLPEGLYKPLRASLAYQSKALASWMLLTEDYPPFWTDEAEEVARLNPPAAPQTLAAPEPVAAQQPPTAPEPPATPPAGA